MSDLYVALLVATELTPFPPYTTSSLTSSFLGTARSGKRLRWKGEKIVSDRGP